MNIITFSRYLTEHPDVAGAFDEHKRHNKEKHADDAERYNQSVSNFIHGVLHCADNKACLIAGERLSIRMACIEDAKFMGEAEQHEDNAPWVGHWPLGWRIEKFGDLDCLQTIIERKNGQAIGFIIFRDLLDCGQQMELKRIVVTEKGKGYGKEALYLSQKFAFERIQTRRLYLSTKKENVYAQNIYKATGFTMDMPDPCTRFHMDKAGYDMVRNRL